MIAAWAARYVGEAAAPARWPKVVADEGTVVVAETGEGRFTQSVSVGGRHLLRADEPASHGGSDIGPSPYDFLLAGLGACTAMTLRMYAELKKLPLERVVVRLKHDKVHAEDCAECETKTGRIDRIEREIEIEGELGEDQRKRLLEIAEKCPVHRTLHSEVWVTTRERRT